jgi:prolyl-tRNA synthetase
MKNDVIMGCYGIGISRLMGIIAEAFADEKGLDWPQAVAPADVHIVPIGKSAEEESYQEARALAEKLEAQGKRCILDDRVDASVGEKLADADLLGIPVRMILSPKTLKENTVEVTVRATGKTEMVPLKDASKVIV